MALMNLPKLNTLMVSDNNLNQEEEISALENNSTRLMQLELKNATATMDIEKD